MAEKLKDTNILGIFYDKTALLILSIGLIVRIITAIVLDPGFDEAYYGSWSYHLFWGYFDHPPAVALFSGIGQWLFGVGNNFTLRFGAIFLLIFSSTLIYSISRMLFEERTARLTLGFAHIVPFFLIGMGLFVFPDNALGFFWLCFLYFVVRLRRSNDTLWFLPIGISLGLCMLAKYHAVLLLAAIGFILIFFKDWRKYWKSPYLYAGFALAILIFLPNIIWNYQNGWISYLYQFGKSGGKIRIRFDLLGQAIGGQAGYLLPWNFVVIIGAIVHFIKNKSEETNWLLVMTLIPAGAFTLLGLTRSILPHWPMPGYIAGIIIAGAWVAKWSKWRPWKYIIISGSTMILFLLVIWVQCLTGILPIDKKTDVTLDGQGWNELADTLEVRGFLDEDNIVISSHKWFTCGEIEWAIQSKSDVIILNKKHSHCYGFWFDYGDFIGKDFIFITTDRYNSNPFKNYSEYFESIEQITSFQTQRLMNPGKQFHIWRLNNMLKPYPAIYR